MFIPISRIVRLFPLPCTAILLSCIALDPPRNAPAGLRAYFVDVGQGDACLLRSPAGRWYLYDTGDEEHVLDGFLRQAGVDTLQAVFISHPDRDHYGALGSVLHGFPVKKAYLPLGNGSDPAWQGTLRALDAFGVERETPVAGAELDLDGARARILWPDPDSRLTGNDLSIVMRVEYGGKRILLTGDIEDAAEKELARAGADLAADILKVAHHGSRTSSGLGFVEAVRPAWAIISCDSAVYGHPHAEAVADLVWVMGDSARISRTDREGTIAFELGLEGKRRVDPFE